MKPRPKQQLVKKNSTSIGGSKPSSADSNSSRPASTTPTTSSGAGLHLDGPAPGELGSTITLQMQVPGETLLVRWKVVYSGPVYFAEGRYLGLVQVEPARAMATGGDGSGSPAVDLWLGDTNGTVDGMQYFVCPSERHGLMMSYELWLQQQVIPVTSRPSSAQCIRNSNGNGPQQDGDGSGKFVAVGGVNALLNMRRSGSHQQMNQHRSSPLSMCDVSTQTGGCSSTSDSDQATNHCETQTDPLPLIPLEAQGSPEAMLQHLARIADLVCSRITSLVEKDETVVQTAAAAQQLHAVLSHVPHLFQVASELDVDCVDVVTQLSKSLPSAQDIPLASSSASSSSSPSSKRNHFLGQDGGEARSSNGVASSAVEEEGETTIGPFQALLRQWRIHHSSSPTKNALLPPAAAAAEAISDLSPLKEDLQQLRHSSFIQRSLTKIASAGEEIASSSSKSVVQMIRNLHSHQKNSEGDDDDDDDDDGFFFGSKSGDLFDQFPSFVKDYILQLRGNALQHYTQQVCRNVFDPLLEYLQNNRVSEAHLRGDQKLPSPLDGIQRGDGSSSFLLPPDVEKYVETRLHTEERIRRLLFSIADLTKQIEHEAAEGNVDALEALALQKVELAQSAQAASAELLEVFEPVKEARCEKPMAKFKSLSKRLLDFVGNELSKACREETRAVDAKMSALEQSVKALKDKMVRDNFKMNKQLGEVCSRYASNMQRQLDLSADISALIKKLGEAERESRSIASELETAFLEKERVVKENCAKGVVRCVERSALLALSRVREWAEDHCAALRHQLSSLEEDEMAALMAVQRTIFEHQSAAHELHLECYRQVCLCSGELQWKKEQALKAIEGRLIRANAELEIAIDSLNPNAKQLALIRNSLEETQAAMGRQVLQICAVATAGEQTFMERTGRLLLEAGKSFRDPKEEVRLLIESKTNRLKMITDAAPKPEDEP